MKIKIEGKHEKKRRKKVGKRWNGKEKGRKEGKKLGSDISLYIIFPSFSSNKMLTKNETYNLRQFLR